MREGRVKMCGWQCARRLATSGIQLVFSESGVVVRGTPGLRKERGLPTKALQFVSRKGVVLLLLVAIEACSRDVVRFSVDSADCCLDEVSTMEKDRR